MLVWRVGTDFSTFGFSLEKVGTYIANRIVYAIILSLTVYKIAKRCTAFIYRLYSVFWFIALFGNF